MLIGFENIIGNIFPVTPRKIDIKIGRRTPVGIDKPFKIQVELDGIYVRNTKHISYYRVRTTAPAHKGIISFLRIPNNIVVDEKVRDKSKFNDHIELFFQSFQNFGFRLGITRGKFFFTQLFQPFNIFLFISSKNL